MAEVRAYMVADKKACLALFDSNVPVFFDATERAGFATFLDSPGGEYFILEEDGAVIGCGGFSKEDRGQARFTWGMVDQTCHGKGLGRLLAEYRLQAIEEARGFSEVELFTTQIVAPFFVRLGFVVVEVEKDGFAPGMDKVQMIKSLN
ncbi:MAG: GNAT family N-acetyltransferase [Parasphingorhabdus sp.]|uniref:GNAT family N-acetyltransferase n=1 Tax=Parasphingorhabdus sp. TaxID=2709688 RepID=UPI003001C7A8